MVPLRLRLRDTDHLDEVEQTVKRMTEGDTDGMDFHDADGNAYDADNHPIDPIDAGQRG
ncbi:hypothetical protein [Streptomyces umbrinus]|uniref:hypothetical protein n=1 Tax=Streptomyces umbrinus TaxID=67370 RepID=UPI003C2C60B7